MEWPSPWGIGFPGWHIECSAMSMKYLGPTLDIHTGGIDHIPIHHTNEIAQSEAITNKPLANHWFHSNHVLIDNQKISKSLGNGIRLQDLVENGFSPLDLRLHILESHYRSQSKFSWDSLESARNRYNDLKAMAVLRWQARPKTYDDTTFAIEDVITEITNLINNDLDTPQILAYLSQVSKQLQAVHIEEDMVIHLNNLLDFLDQLLGLELSAQADISPEQKKLINKRQNARNNHQWQESDNIRQILLSQGIILRDENDGSIWSRV